MQKAVGAIEGFRHGQKCSLEILLWGGVEEDLEVCGKAYRVSSFPHPHGCPI